MVGGGWELELEPLSFGCMGGFHLRSHVPVILGLVAIYVLSNLISRPGAVDRLLSLVQVSDRQTVVVVWPDMASRSGGTQHERERAFVMLWHGPGGWCVGWKRGWVG